jgi:polyhydroxyalkanoate synthase
MGATILLVLCAALGFLMITWGLIAAWCRIEFSPDQLIPVKTADGHGLFLYRHQDTTVPTRGAVLCLHGLGASHFNFDFPGPANFAGHLARQGYDVFVASLRGDFDALPPGRSFTQWTFDDHVQRDLPALMDAVQRESGVRRVHLLGHSMGGLLAYAYIAVHGEAAVASVVALGSPVGFKEGPRFFREAWWLKGLLMGLPAINVRLFSRLTWLFLAVGFRSSMTRIQFNADNMDRATALRATWHALSPLSRDILLQFGEWMSNDSFCSLDGTHDYRASLRNLRVPLMVVAGAADRICIAANAVRAHELAQSPLKYAHVLAKSETVAFDYGHLDLVFGVHAARDVFERVTSFLMEADALNGNHGGGERLAS